MTSFYLGRSAAPPACTGAPAGYTFDNETLDRRGKFQRTLNH